MAKIYVTLEIDAKDKLEAYAKAKSLVANRYDISVYDVHSTKMKKNNTNLTYYLEILEACINCNYKETCNNIIFPNCLCDKCDKYEKNEVK